MIMPDKKIIFGLLLCLGLISGQQVLAALSIPKNQPLQTAPVGIKPNVTNNINSADSESNVNLDSQNQPSDIQPEPEPTDNTQNNLDQTAPIVGEVSTTSTTSYWIALFIGLLGLVGALIWTYIRFVRN
jgi:hypothetical protein